jgi:hypothetical protein
MEAVSAGVFVPIGEIGESLGGAGVPAITEAYEKQGS